MNQDKTVGVILSGCGVYDGSEIHEATLTLLALSQRGLNVKIFAPDIPQMHAVNHATGNPDTQQRNVLEESARIARGQIAPLSQMDIRLLDGIILPGGFGAAKNLCNYATAGTEMEVLPELAKVLKQAHDSGKPLGFICIAPIMIPKIFGAGIRATLGTKGDDSAAFIKMGGEHIECCVEHAVVDDKAKIISTPAYMVAQTISQAHAGIDQLVCKMADML